MTRTIVIIIVNWIKLNSLDILDALIYRHFARIRSKLSIVTPILVRCLLFSFLHFSYCVILSTFHVVGFCLVGFCIVGFCLVGFCPYRDFVLWDFVMWVSVPNSCVALCIIYAKANASFAGTPRVRLYTVDVCLYHYTSKLDIHESSSCKCVRPIKLVRI